jgi:hypothetical protein
MSLDVDFFIPGNNEPVHDLRKHDWLFDQFHDLAGDLVDEDYTDFYVDEEAFDVVTERVIAELEDLGLDPAQTPPDVPDATQVWGEDDFSWEIMLYFYLKVLTELRNAASEHGPLICAWSA